MQEEWKAVPFEELKHYEVSTFGNVRLLPRDVETHIVNRGRDMMVTAKRKGKDIKIQYDGGRPLVRMLDSEGHRRKFSLPLLMLKTFKMDECPGDVDKYTAGYLDGDVTNNRLDNIIWISKSALMSSISATIKGEAHQYLAKYEYIIIKVNNQIVGYFANTTEGAELFNSYGIETSASALGRSLKEGKQFYFMFDFEAVSPEEYEIISMNYPQINLKTIYDIVIEDRRHCRKVNEKVKTVVKKEVVEKVVYKPKVEKQIVYKDRIVYKEKPVKEKKNEEIKEKKKRLVNDSVPNVEKTKSQTVKTTKQKTSKLDDIDDKLFYEEQEREKKQKFMEEMSKRLHIGI